MAQVIKGAITTQIRRFFCNYKTSTELTRHSSDFLLNNLKGAATTKHVLEMVAQHNNIMNNKHVIQALRTLFILQKNGHSELSTNEILANQDFKKLCRKLRNHAGGIELNDTLEALKVVSYVGVSSDSTIFQVLLQLIRHNINNLSIKQIMFLDFLLSQTIPSPLVDALKIAIPLVFEIQLPIKMDYTNILQLTDCLFFASRHNMSVETIDRIVNALMKHQDFDAKTAKSIVWSLCDMDTDEAFRPLMTKAINVMVVHVDDLSFTDLESTLTKLINRFSRKSTYFYNEPFYDSCGNHVIDKDLGFKSAIYILRKYGRVNFFHRQLLDYVCKKIHDDPSLMSKPDPVVIYSIAVTAAMTDYRSPHWETVKNLIANSENISHIDKKEIIWLKFASSLCLLDIFKVDVLSKCLNEVFLKQLFSKKKFMSDFENYATIWQCIKMFKPELNCLLMAEFDPEVVVSNYKPPLEFPLETALHKAFGGEIYVRTNLSSKFGVQIDHAVMFRKGGYPVAFNCSDGLVFIEDIEVPPNHHLIAILGLRHYNYTLNKKLLKCSTQLAIKVLEQQGVQVVPICLETWEELPDFEKIPFLMRALKERTSVNDLVLSQDLV